MCPSRGAHRSRHLTAPTAILIRNTFLSPEAKVDDFRYLASACLGVFSILLATPAVAQQGRASGRPVVELSEVHPARVIVFSGSSSARVHAGHPHGGPPGQLKKLNGWIPPGQAKKLYGRIPPGRAKNIRSYGTRNNEFSIRVRAPDKNNRPAKVRKNKLK